ncbi:hypothetical protein Avbf_11287 [Armadillidium vulgare]|nr:hypothetical protein Avbf_11287 [Armadillidium vulgare]
MDEGSSCFSDSQFSCEGCENTICSFVVLSESLENLLQFLYDHGVLPKTKTCPKCGSDMVLDENNYNFNCNIECKTSVSQLIGTWFENSELTMKVICRFVMFWALLHSPRQYILQQELDLPTNTIVEWSNFLREVCFHYIMSYTEPIGGKGKVVEIEEAKIGSRKYHPGRIIEDNWVFTGVERGSKKTFMISVPTENHGTLLSVIKEYIMPETTIISKSLETYQCLEFEGYDQVSHLTAEHNYNIIDTDRGSNTQIIQRICRDIKSYVPRFINRKHHFNGYIAEFLFKRKFNNYRKRLHNLWMAIADLHDGSESNRRCQPPVQQSELQDSGNDYQETRYR